MNIFTFSTTKPLFVRSLKNSQLVACVRGVSVNVCIKKVPYLRLVDERSFRTTFEKCVIILSLLLVS